MIAYSSKKGGHMSLCGWKSIREHTGLSENAIKELSKEKNNPFPLVYIKRKPFTTKERFTLWINTEIDKEKRGYNS
jgi:hypothetical protein